VLRINIDFSEKKIPFVEIFLFYNEDTSLGKQLPTKIKRIRLTNVRMIRERGSRPLKNGHVSLMSWP